MKRDWPRRRAELLRTRIDRLGLSVHAAPLSGSIRALYRDLESAGIRFRPPCYLSNSWGCPDRVPLIGIPFHLARADLSRLHREMGFDVEGSMEILRLLRHEAAHAFSYAYRLYARPDWRATFGPFHKAYHDQYVFDPFSSRYVAYGRHYYAQKHPDEDFAETFAVLIDPRSRWRKRYAGKEALRKLRYVEAVVREFGRLEPCVRGGRSDCPIGEMRFTLRDFYGGTPEAFRREADSYADALLARIFPAPRAARGAVTARDFIKRHGRALAGALSFWSGLDRRTVSRVTGGLARRARRCRRAVPLREREKALADLASLLAFLVYTYVHTRRIPLR